METDPARFKESLQRAANLTGRALRRARLHSVRNGYAVDSTGFTLSRWYWAPNTTVDGAERTAEVVLIREEPFDLERPGLHDPAYAESVLKAKEALDDLCAGVVCKTEGDRNDHLNKTAFLLGGLVKVGTLSREEVEERLLESALKSGLTDEESRRTIRSGIDAGIERPADDPDDDRPVIHVTAELHQMVDEAIDALADDFEEVGVYEKNGTLVQPVLDGQSGWITSPITEAGLQDKLSKVARFVKPGRTPATGTHVLPTTPCVRATIVRPDYPRIPAIEGISKLPVLRADGTLRSEPGYDEASKTLLTKEAASISIRPPGSDFDPVENGRQLMRPYDEYVFPDLESKGALMALIHTIVGRAMLGASVPGWVINGSSPEVGKTMAAQIAYLIAIGQLPDIFVEEHDNTELSKALLTTAIYSLPVMIVDNLRGMLDAPPLEAAITSGRIAGRLLGHNKLYRGPFTAIPVLTGVGVTTSDELASRLLQVFIGSGDTAFPGKRPFKIKDLLGLAKKEQPALYACAVRALMHAKATYKGQELEGDRFSGFEIVRWAVMQAGYPDPVKSRGKLIKDNEDLQLLDRVLAGLEESYPNGGTLKEMLSKPDTAFARALDEIPRKPGESPRDTGVVGRYLRRNCPQGSGRVTNFGRKLMKAGKDPATWWVARVKDDSTRFIDPIQTETKPDALPQLALPLEESAKEGPEPEF